MNLRIEASGKFFLAGDEKFYIKGVTYGPFRPLHDGSEYGTEDAVRRDFSMMAENGINTVRTYTVPPVWLLDIAHENGLHVFAGIPWEQHITFLDDRSTVLNIGKKVKDSVRSTAGHAALLGYAVGNEIPAPIVRWYGRRRIERFIQQLYNIAKNEDPDALVTYVNYPTTEYLQLPFLDFQCFNVYLETPERLISYFARMQNIAGDKPLVLGELGLDSLRNSTEKQAEVLSWQIDTAFSEGSAGMFVFSWTDEWFRGGYEIDDWNFGLTDRERNPKPALYSVSERYSVPAIFSKNDYPFISVVVCTYNGAKTLRRCFDGLRNLNYPRYEVIVVNDGSRDSSEAIAGEYGFKVITVSNGGLSNARNLGWRAASGEIVAYIDDDAWPDEDWLYYLAHTYLTTDYAAVGGPNIAPSGVGVVADAVDNSPGGPTHVLLNDTEAEHIPGCNMSFRKKYLQEIGGFDRQFTIAGDDVDVCWRIQERGWKIGFNASAMVWHYRRDNVRQYLKQQYNYGRAEAMLEQKWPEKYNTIGHLTWKGRLYGKGLTPSILHRGSVIYQGVWGTAPFQRLYEPALGRLTSLPLMPEGYVFISFFLFLSLLGFLWAPLVWALPLFVLGAGISILQAVVAGIRASFRTKTKNKTEHLKKRVMTMYLHLMQPLARLMGRVSKGLTPWRFRGKSGWIFPIRSTITVWSERWRASGDWLEKVESKLKRKKIVSFRGGNYDRWDLSIAGGMFGSAKSLMTVEEHGGGKQNVRWRIWPVFSLRSILAVALLGGLAFLAMLDHAWVTGGILTALALVPFFRWFIESGKAVADFRSAIRDIEDDLEREIISSQEDNKEYEVIEDTQNLIDEHR